MVSNVIYDLHLLFWRAIINIFFREIRPRGAYNIPKDGPVMFVAAPHHNQFLDPLLLSTEIRKEAHRRIGYLTAAASMDRRVVGLGAKLMNSIPVARAADYSKTGSGLITLSAEDPTLVKGIGTRFTKECMERGQIVLPKSVGYAHGDVIEVISDTELRLRADFSMTGKGGAVEIKATSRIISELENAAHPVEGEPKAGLAYKSLPHVEQSKVYGAVYKVFHEGGVVGIFPEGGSHDRTDLLPLKAGVSIMTLGAMAADPNCKIKLVPVGLSYFAPHKFRSRAVVEFGAPLDVSDELVEMFKEGGAKKRDACGKLLETIHDGLKTVTIRTPDYDTLLVIQAGRRLYKAPGQQLSLGQVVELNKRFIEAYEHFKDEPRIIALRINIIAYNRRLRNLGLRDHQIERATTTRRWRNFFLLIYRSFLLLAWAILALPGVITHAPIFIPAKMVSDVKRKQALAASTVKVAARDVIATWKVLFSLCATPALYIVYAIITTYLAYRYGAPAWVYRLIPVWIIVGMPFLAMSSLRFGEAGMDVFKSLRPLFLSLLPGSQKELESIRKERESLANELSELINEYGPKLWNNFHQSRLLPSAASPQTGEQPGLLYRKGKTVDNSVLNHPMLWLDERIFGWRRSYAKGANAWDSKSSRTAGSVGPSSPHESDEEDVEDDVDYDDVLAIIDTRKPRSARGGRDGSQSRPKTPIGYRKSPGSNGSKREDAAPTADIDSIRTFRDPGEGGEAGASSAIGEEGSKPTRRHARTTSLTSGVTLGAISDATSAPDRSGGSVTFDEAAQRLNGVAEKLEEGKGREKAD